MELFKASNQWATRPADERNAVDIAVGKLLTAAF